VTLENCTFVGNIAGQFGGGVTLGGGGTGATCGLVMSSGTVFDNNIAQHSGSQLHMSCTGDVTVTDTTFLLNDVGLQVSGVAVASLPLSPSSAPIPPNSFVYHSLYHDRGAALVVSSMSHDDDFVATGFSGSARTLGDHAHRWQCDHGTRGDAHLP
jgi:hypothetical protein